MFLKRPQSLRPEVAEPLGEPSGGFCASIARQAAPRIAKVRFEATTKQTSILDPPAKGVPVLTSVQDSGITVDPQLRDTDSQIRRFLHHTTERAKLKDALPTIDTTTKGKIRFLECGARAQVEFEPTSARYRIRSRTCGHRWCPACRRAFVADLREKLELANHRQEKYAIKFITLTIRSKSNPLRQQIDFLWKSFRRLRQTTLWKRRAKWGVAILEVTYNSQQNQWHPHIHIISESGFIPQKALSKTWEKASGGSRVCDIRAVKNTSTAINYVTKYATKGTLNESTLQSPELTAELLNSLKRMKTVLWFGKKPEQEETEDEPQKEKIQVEWHHVCGFDHLCQEARKGNQTANDILRALDLGERGPPPDDSILYWTRIRK